MCKNTGMLIFGLVKSSTNAKTKPGLITKENARTKLFGLKCRQIQNHALAGILSLCKSLYLLNVRI